MPGCETCNDLLENLEPEVTPNPGSIAHGLQLSYDCEVPISQWRNSAQGGCTACQLIWDIVIHFSKELALNLTTSSLDAEAKICLEGWSGLPLTLTLDDLPHGKHFPNLEVYAPSRYSSSFPVLGHGTDVSEHLELSHCVRLSQDWIAQCSKDHAQCNTGHVGRLPTRVLALTSRESQIAVRLHVSEPGQIAQYVALSYCWGSVGNLKTTSATIGKWKAGVPWNLIPRSFRDAIAITKGLGIQYLWIDSLCIIQDDTDDWEREASRMAQVYENAFITIATDAAKDPTCDILVARSKEQQRGSDDGVQQPERCTQIAEVSILDRHGTLVQVHAREYRPHFELISTMPAWNVTYPLLARAWTLQERLLPRRTLHFTAYELLWECRTTLYCECGSVHREFCGGDWRGPKIGYERAITQVLEERDASFPSQLSDQPLSKLSTSTWTRIVSGYSCRQLTYSSDKLIAISGIAEKFSSIGTSSKTRTYLAGLWREDLPWLLCWRAYRRRYNDRSPVYCAPTWSWASMRSPVIWDTVTFDAASKVNVIDAATIIPGPGHNKLGRVTSGHVVMQGSVQHATIDLGTCHSAVMGIRNPRGEKIFFVPDHNRPDWMPAPESSDINDGDTTCPQPQGLQRTAYSLRPSETVFCLLLLQNTTGDSMYGLALASASPAVVGSSQKQSSSTPSSICQGKNGVLERIGIITEMSFKYERNEVPVSAWFAGATVETVTVI